MKTLRNTIISLPVLALLLALGPAGEAQAGVRFKASLRTPHARIVVDNGAFHHVRGYRRPLPVRYHQEFRITKKDRRIARRLARYTGVPKRELIQLKKMGYSWNEIGRWLGVSRKAVRAARSQASWERFLNRHHRVRFLEVGGYCDD